ncbi:MAG: CoA ester lyase [Betaproteobacteria bacterium]|nr:CoA ester lyase [Betaproteobacteria bacterium]
MRTCRSWMFVPGHIAKMVQKAPLVSADAIMLDIEDGVLPASKPQARQVIAREVPKMSGNGQIRFVRTNAIQTEDFKLDLDAVVGLNIAGIVLAKVETPDDVLAAVLALEKLERAHGVKRPLQLVAAIESAKGIIAAPQIAAASRRLVALMLGAEDLGRDIGLPAQRVAEAHELVYARSALVIAAAAGRIQSIDQVWPNLGDAEGLKRDATQARRLGFTGKAIIHPSQAEPVNAAFTPSVADIDFAQRVLAAFREAEANGLGAVSFGGQLLDKPIVDRAKAVLERSRQS